MDYFALFVLLQYIFISLQTLHEGEKEGVSIGMSVSIGIAKIIIALK